MGIANLRERLRTRLRAIQAELGRSDAQMGELLEIDRTRWGQWVATTGNKPAEELMITLCDRAGVTMDWLYRGRLDNLPVRLAIRLELRLLGIDPDQATDEQKASIVARIAERVP